MENVKLHIVFVLFTAFSSVFAQETKEVIHQAMAQEISRNMKNLHLEGMKDPFYIGLNVVDMNMLVIHSSLGALIKVSETPNRDILNLQLLVGDYNDNNLNYMSAPYFLRSFGRFPLDNSLSEIQRRLWLLFDRSYKLSTKLYESKKSALRSTAQNDDIAGLPDYVKGEKVLIEEPEIPLKFNNDNLIKYANEISLTLRSYRYISNSWVKIVGYKANIYYSNSEGSKATYPSSVLRLVIDIESQAANGELLELYLMFHVPNETDLPGKDKVIKEVQVMAETLAELKSAPVFDDIYTGPVLFEDQAAGEAMRKTMFYKGNENLVSVRKLFIGGSGGIQTFQNKISTDDRIDKKLSNEDLNVKAKPTMSEYKGIPLIGSYPVDMDGIIPPQETILIENGILRNLLCGRIPTAKMKVSNGHFRVPLNYPWPMIVPGVIEVDFNNSFSKEDLKKKLIEVAQSEGLDYALIVREITPYMSELKKVYKVDLKTGKEQLIRLAAFNGLTLNDLKKIICASNHKIVLNTMAGEDIQHKLDNLTGCPATFITPDAFLFKDIEITRNNRPVMKKLPVVKNPLEL